VEELIHLVESYLDAAVGARTGEGDLDLVSDAHMKLLVYVEELEALALEEVGFD
jgi:hypothetical protein